MPSKQRREVLEESIQVHLNSRNIFFSSGERKEEEHHN